MRARSDRGRVKERDTKSAATPTTASAARNMTSVCPIWVWTRSLMYSAACTASAATSVLGADSTRAMPFTPTGA